ncbi:MAG: DEAD/DEAH box helicase family protein [Prevotella sp.]|nr:DEAD/DEAH box helicase family protein [Prevotella sp.]
MELKEYQRGVLNDLSSYLDYLDKEGNAAKAFSQYWENKGIKLDVRAQRLHPYKDTVKGVANVAVKVPTAGGKTFIACHAVKRIFDGLPAPRLGKVVVWFVPTDTILTQTFNNLNNPQHPYRQTLNLLFNNRVQVVDKEAALMGNNISPTEISEQLTIFVLSVQSFIERTTHNHNDQQYLNTARAARENGNLNEYVSYIQHYYDEKVRIENVDESSLIQYIAMLHPVTIVDESHKFGSLHRITALGNLNPRFILNLTATPLDDSNIISYVDASKLKKENMVKLPVIVMNNHDKNEVISNAILLQQQLESKAREEEEQGGKYIRPIVLCQAEPKTNDDAESFEKIRKNLIDRNIPEEQIKIKTANINELKNIDLMSRDCPVRYIITVNALNEGWDCPFAYVLATIANRSSQVEVEQIVGRILRQPYTRHNHSIILNESFVLTCSNDFSATVTKVVKTLNDSGYSRKDYRIANPIADDDTKPATPDTKQQDLFHQGTTDQTQSKFEEKGKSGEEWDNPKEEDVTPTPKDPDKAVHDFEKQAENIGKKYQEEIDQQTSNTASPTIPEEDKEMIHTYHIKEQYREMASQIVIPNFVIRTKSNDMFMKDVSEQPLYRETLLKGFKLASQNSEIDFNVDLEVRSVDLDPQSKGETTMRSHMLNDTQLNLFRQAMDNRDKKGKIGLLRENIRKELERDNTLSHGDCMTYIEKVLEAKSETELVELEDRIPSVVNQFKMKIRQLQDNYAKKEFEKNIDADIIIAKPDYHFMDTIIVNNASPLPKGLYEEEEDDMDSFEHNVIEKVANLDNVLFWHRNLPRLGGFCIRGYIHNHYPDFIVVTTNGTLVLLETKGPQLANADSQYKLEIGDYWKILSDKLQDRIYRYFMVFPDGSNKLDKAKDVSTLIDILKKL